MPEYYDYTTEDYERFYAEVCPYPFRKLETREKQEALAQSSSLYAYHAYVKQMMSKNKELRHLLPKSKKVGFEDGIAFEKSFKVSGERDITISVHCWVTHVMSQKKQRKNDQAWVLIRDSRRKKPVYYSFPLHRTKHYFRNLKEYALAAVHRVETWPCCDLCGRPLHLFLLAPTSEKRLFSYFFRLCNTCFPEKIINGKFFFQFSVGMDKKPAKVFERKHARYSKQRKRQQDRGEDPIPRVFLKSEKKKQYVKMLEQFIDAFPADTYFDELPVIRNEYAESSEYYDGPHLE